MKKFFSTVFFSLSFLVGFSQSFCVYDFEYNYDCLGDTVWIDTVSNPNNIWQIGDFNATLSTPNSIYAGDDPLPFNDTSSFIFVHLANEAWGCNGSVSFSGYYINQFTEGQDSIFVEFSPDKGDTWIDLLHDTIYDQYIFVYPSDFMFSENTEGWQNFDFNLSELTEIFSINYGDTLLFKVTIITDTILNITGLSAAFDNIMPFELCGAISENNLIHFSSSIFPNPTNNITIIEFENPTNSNFNLQVFDITGRAVIEQNIRTNRTQLNTQNLPPGIYQYRLLSEKERKQSFGKFVVE